MSDFCCRVVAVVIGWGLQFPGVLIPFLLSIGVEARPPRDVSTAGWRLHLPRPTFQHLAFRKSCGWAGKLLRHPHPGAQLNRQCDQCRPCPVQPWNSLVSRATSASACLWLQLHTRMSGPEKAAIHLEGALSKRSKSLSSSLNDKLGSLRLWEQGQNLFQ